MTPEGWEQFPIGEMGQATMPLKEKVGWMA